MLCTADPSSDAASPLGAAGSCETLIQSELRMTDISDDTALLFGVTDGHGQHVVTVDSSVMINYGKDLDPKADMVFQLKKRQSVCGLRQSLSG